MRVATSADEDVLASFDRPGLHGADADGLRSALADGRAWVAEESTTIVGVLIFEAPGSGHLRLVTLAGSGVSALLHEVLRVRELGPENCSLSALVDTADHAAARLLLGSGFFAARVVRDGERRLLYCQYNARVHYVDPDERYLVPASASDQLFAFLDGGDHAITGMVGTSFEVSRFERDDPAALQSAEAAAGIAFSGAVLAAMTFLLGFAFASARYPDSVRVLLIAATALTTLSLIIYASASGELARIKANVFGNIMKWGNVLSEYGGVLPFIISLPMTYAEVTRARWSAILVAAVLSAGLLIYESSAFSIADRFSWTLPTRTLAVLTGIAPLAGTLLSLAGTGVWLWTLTVTATLTARAVVYLFRRGPEGGIAEFRGRSWQVRR
ncbi:hypothetical protein [Actinomadura sp. 3N508]|uniref:hypothetical protein n=1 Tax=Actinomadura sp. 3N508 TaxID=3375153 RepID=UPI0037AB2AE7